ncbi:hypothetical protein CRE_22553 [Caenorhabditis remanei]|uniref:Sdz-33 F-box domain-containing protein n=2 Tax=Caenorhabditis remanei TaxID=31234 RepID=E3MU39_CAERE|nr:hypothetical protein CRE_22553 [Caenorhabditis remanei]
MSELKLYCFPNVVLNVVLELMHPIELQLPSVPQYTLKLYYSGNLVPTINQWTTYLSNVFNVLPTSLSLEYNCFENGTINKIMDAYCTDVNSMKHVELINNEELNQSKDAIISFLQRQNATEKIKLLFQPITDFVFDFKLLRNIPSCIKCKYANWITYKQLMEFESESVYLSRSNFTNSDFKNLVVKWRNGWNPTWKDLMIEFREDLNIDAYISDSYIEINREDHYRNVLMRSCSLNRISSHSSGSVHCNCDNGEQQNWMVSYPAEQSRWKNDSPII